MCLNSCPCGEPWWMCWAQNLWSSLLWKPLDTHWLLAASNAHKDSRSFPHPFPPPSPLFLSLSLSDSQVHKGMMKAIEQILVLYLLLCTPKDPFSLSSKDMSWCCCSLFRLMMTFKNTEQFQITSIIHPGTYVQQCMESIFLSSWIWRKAANELFFFYNWSLRTCVYVCACDLMKAVACLHGLDLCLEQPTMSDKTSSSSLACAHFPLRHSLTTRDWDSIRISEHSVSSSSPGDLLLIQQEKSTRTHIETPFPLLGSPPVVSIKELVQSMS